MFCFKSVRDIKFSYRAKMGFFLDRGNENRNQRKTDFYYSFIYQKVNCIFCLVII
nr:MAG TPA: hypothetical protein [Caudoviricetes sp.]